MDLPLHCKSLQKNRRSQPLVLAVDDNEDNLQLLSQLLVLLDCTFITATDGETTLVMADHQPDLILLDMLLPDLSGVEVVQRLKQNSKTRDIPVIAVTAMARQEDRDHFILAGCIDYVKKPYIIDEMESIILRYVCIDAV